MKLSAKEFEKEIQTALGFLLEIEDHCKDMDSDDIIDMCKDIEFPLRRMLDNLQSGKLKQKEF